MEVGQKYKGFKKNISLSSLLRVTIEPRDDMNEAIMMKRRSGILT